MTHERTKKKRKEKRRERHRQTDTARTQNCTKLFPATDESEGVERERSGLFVDAAVALAAVLRGLLQRGLGQERVGLAGAVPARASVARAADLVGERDALLEQLVLLVRQHLRAAAVAQAGERGDRPRDGAVLLAVVQGDAVEDARDGGAVVLEAQLRACRPACMRLLR